MLFAGELLNKAKIGYYQGDPLKIIEDCALLKPYAFPSVPRLYNRIYAKIKGKFGAETGCKKWLIDHALSVKYADLKKTGSLHSGCYDALVFNKVSSLLGGNVKFLITGSAPTDKNVIDLLKVCFSCPV